ncbi:MAG: TraR/DksA C4-type zinc finger protein [Deltaproteobacteria bacterium]|nr:TraR/DksA C4-type zinc finger protein [Deltaproteobacteria bacterium]
MKKKDLERFKKILLMERQSILGHLSSLEEESQSELSQSSTSDPSDFATVEINQAEIQKIGNYEKKMLHKISVALQKIESGEYGICENCGEEISLARLEARPVAQLCIDCKTEMEQNERRYSDNNNDEDEWSTAEEFEE